MTANSLAWLLLEATLRTTIFAAVVMMLLTVLRIRSAAFRSAWVTAVVLFGLAMPWIREVVPAFEVVAPVQRATEPVLALDLPEAATLPADDPAPIRSAWEIEPTFDWMSMGGVGYLAGAVLLLVRLVGGLAAGWHLRRNARPVPGMATVETRESDAIRVPVTLGFWNPVILLPADWRSWDARKLEAVLLHESAHVAQGDYLRQLLAQVHECLFWLNPMSWWLTRKLAESCEQAADDRVLGQFPDRFYYAEVLVGFVRVRTNRNRILWSSIAMATPTFFGDRIERILNLSGPLTRNISRLSLLVLGAAAIPAALLTATVTFAQPAPPAPAQPPAPTSVQAPPAPRPAPVPAPALTPRGSRTPVAPPAPTAVPDPAAVAPPVPPAAPRPGSPVRIAPPPPPPPPPAARGDRWVVVTKSGPQRARASRSDQERAAAFRGQISGDYIWLERDGREYLIEDPETIRELLDSSEQFGALQAATRRQQEELARGLKEYQQRLPEYQEAMRKAQAEVAALQQKLSSEQFAETYQQAQKALQHALTGLQKSAREMERAHQESAAAHEAASEARHMEELTNAVIGDAMSRGKAKPVK